MCTLIQGRFWKIGSYNGKPVFRQEPGGGVNNEQLFLWFGNGADAGWYISKSLLEAKKRSEAFRVKQSGSDAWSGVARAVLQSQSQ